MRRSWREPTLLYIRSGGDPSTLLSLPERGMLCFLVVVVKYALPARELTTAVLVYRRFEGDVARRAARSLQHYCTRCVALPDGAGSGLSILHVQIWTLLPCTCRLDPRVLATRSVVCLYIELVQQLSMQKSNK